MARHKKFSSIGQDLTQEIIEGKTYRTNRKIDKIAVHCSASPQGRGDDANTIDRWHQSNPGWGGIGYHYVILEDGTVLKGRWLDFMPIHAKGYNAGAIAICRIGGMGEHREAIHDATDKQKKMIALLCELLISEEMYDLTIDDVKGHKEFPKVKKSCPLMSMNEIRNMIEKNISGSKDEIEEKKMR